MSEPLMNLPQWFLEKSDSQELFKKISETYGDPVKHLIEINSDKNNYILFIEGNNHIFLTSHANYVEIEKKIVETNKMCPSRPIFVYNKQEDMFKTITLTIEVTEE